MKNAGQEFPAQALAHRLILGKTAGGVSPGKSRAEGVLMEGTPDFSVCDRPGPVKLGRAYDPVGRWTSGWYRREVGGD